MYLVLGLPAAGVALTHFFCDVKEGVGGSTIMYASFFSGVEELELSDRGHYY